MTTIFRRPTRRASRLVLPLVLIAGAWVAGPAPAFGQGGKEPTDGFFDVPKREGPPAWGLPEYLTTSTLAAAAIFILCKSARRT